MERSDGPVVALIMSHALSHLDVRNKVMMHETFRYRLLETFRYRLLVQDGGAERWEWGLRMLRENTQMFSGGFGGNTALYL